MYILHSLECMIHMGIGKHAYKQCSRVTIESMSTFFLRILNFNVLLCIQALLSFFYKITMTNS